MTSKKKTKGGAANPQPSQGSEEALVCGESHKGGVAEPDIVDAELVDFGPVKKEWSYHLSMLILASGVVLASLILEVRGQETVALPGARVPLGPSCYSRVIFGIDCPGCGLTRSFISMGNLDFEAAFAFNPAGPIAFLFTCTHVVWQAYQLRRMSLGRSPFFSKWLMIWPGAVFLTLLGQWIFRFWI